MEMAIYSLENNIMGLFVVVFIFMCAGFCFFLYMLNSIEDKVKWEAPAKIEKAKCELDCKLMEIERKLSQENFEISCKLDEIQNAISRKTIL